MLARFERGETIDLLGPLDRTDRIGSIDWSVLSDERFRRMKTGALTYVRRYAIVGAPDWMEAADRDEEVTVWTRLNKDRRVAA